MNIKTIKRATMTEHNSLKLKNYWWGIDFAVTFSFTY